MTLDRVLVIGTGLIGTSIGLALTRAGVDVLLDDLDPDRVRLAAELGAGRPAPASAEPVDHAVLAVPPALVAPVLARVQRERLAVTASDVASVKAAPLAEAAALGCDLTRFVGGHPVAGRERAGPAGARADLFVGRPWVLTPQGAGPAAVEVGRAVAERCGGVPVLLAAEEHDQVMALVSHAPQLVASSLAALLLDAPAAAVALAGAGFRDTTRIAESDPQLWAEIGVANAGPLADTVDRVAATLALAAVALRAGDRAGLAELVTAGNAGRARLPGKHSRAPATYAAVPVVVPDEPGQLARLLADAATTGINVEDLVVEHAPGALLGVIELAVAPAAAARLTAALEARGWSVHPTGAD